MSQPIPHALSFIVNDQLQEIDFLATPAEATELFRRMDALRTTVQDWNVRPLSPPEPGSASELLTTIVEAVATDEAEDAEIQALTRLAEASDALAEEDASPLMHEVSFVWDNGGGDDNAFTQAFLGSSQPAGIQASTAFSDAMEQWLDNHGHAYDFSIGPAQVDKPTDTMAEAVHGLAQKMADAEDVSLLASFWVKTLSQVVDDITTQAAAPSRRKPGPR